MNWIKLGKIFLPNKKINWMQSHAAVPFLDEDFKKNYILYFTSRNKKNQSYIGRLFLDKKFNIIKVDHKPVLSPGGLGTFDEYGVTASYMINVKKKKLLYYVGWNLGTSTPFRNALGLAISNDGGKNFKKISKGPIMDRSYVDPCFVAGAKVLYENNSYKMWYISCINWKLDKGKPKHYYHLKYATSKDGINWKKDGTICIDFKSKYEYAISQPWVIKEKGIYKMWYSYRAQKNIKTYRIGYAESKNGINWKRLDNKVGIDVSKKGWDSKMICYPSIYNINENKIMFYNGNEYGKSGIGMAILKK